MNGVSHIGTTGKPVGATPPVASLWHLLSEHAARHPDQAAVVTLDLAAGSEQIFSYSELRRAVIRCANYLHTRFGVAEQTHFGFMYDNRAEVLILSLAGALLGAASAPLDARRDVVQRMQYKLERTESRVLITHPRGNARRDKVEQCQALLPSIPVVAFDDHHSLLDELALYAPMPAFPVATTSEHVYLTLFTSGTTAEPKGAQLTSANLLFNAHAIKQWLQITDTDRFAAILPLHHINSTTFCLATLLAGGTVVLIAEPPKERFWEVMATHTITITSIVQRIVDELLKLQHEFEPVRNDLVLSRIQVGSDVVDPASVLRFIEQYGIPLYQGYGLTEVAFRATGVPMRLAWDDYLELVRSNTIGMALQHMHVAILDDAGQEVKPGEEHKGEICVRGPSVMQGYLRDPAATAAVFRGGWFHSGDIGWYEDRAQGRCFFYHGRAKEIIKKGAALLSPAAIDQAVQTAFPDIAETCAIGYPDDRWGEDVWLIVTFRENVVPERREKLLTEIVNVGKAEGIPGLPKFEAPCRVVDFDRAFPGASLPRTSTMKVQRTRLKAMIVARFPPAGTHKY